MFILNFKNMEKYTSQVHISCKINAHYSTFNKLANAEENAERKCL